MEYLQLVLLGVCVLAAVVASWQARRAIVAAQSGDVVEIGRAVEKLARAQRSDTMRRVRAAAGPDPQHPLPFAPPELVGGSETPQGDIHTIKAQLRRQHLR